MAKLMTTWVQFDSLSLSLSLSFLSMYPTCSYILIVLTSHLTPTNTHVHHHRTLVAGGYKQGDRVGVLLDLDEGSLLFFKNGVQCG
jgi:hypothetical protein